MKISLIDVNHSCKLYNILKDVKMTLSEQIQEDIKTNSIILYMKGTRLMPMCGFSSTMVNILNMHGIEYKDIYLTYIVSGQTED